MSPGYPGSSTFDEDHVDPGNIQAGMALLIVIALISEVLQVVLRTLLTLQGPNGFLGGGSSQSETAVGIGPLLGRASPICHT